MADGEKTLEGVLKTAFRSMLAGVETGLPAVVEAYDYTTQTVKVRPVPKIYFDDGTTERLPALEGVPVLFPSGAGFAITWPLAAGDPVWLAFSGRPFKHYLATQDPASGRRSTRSRSEAPMSLNAAQLGTQIKNALVSAGYVLDDADARADCEAIWQAIAGAIVSHIQTSAEVSTTVAAGVAVQVDPTTGIGATTGTGAGTGSIQ